MSKKKLIDEIKSLRKQLSVAELRAGHAHADAERMYWSPGGELL